MTIQVIKAIKMANMQLISWVVVLAGVLLSIFVFNSAFWGILIIAGYAFQIFGAAYIFVITNHRYGNKLLYYNIFICICLIILILISKKIIPTTTDNDAEYTIIYGSIFLVILLYFFSIFLISSLKALLKDL